MLFSKKNKFCFFVTTLGIAFIATSALAADEGNPSGKTANGCSYKVINGKYLYDCTNAKASAPVQQQSDAAPSRKIVENYSSVPVLHNASAPIPSISQVPVSVPTQQREMGANSSTSENKERSNFSDLTYAGLSLGSTTLSASSAGSSLGVGVSLGANLDDYLGIELGYSYSSQGLNLGLANRAGSGGVLVNTNDSSLNAHLVDAELQFHLTDTYKRLRPFLGIGAAYKSSKLTDDGTAAYGAYQNSTASTLSQSSFGAIGSIGTKLRFSDNVQGVVAFRYFLPVTNSSPKLETQNSYTSSNAARLTAADSPLTKANLYQLLAGVQYLF